MHMGLVERIQPAIHAPMVLLPVPWPDDAAIRIGMTGSVRLNPRFATSRPRSRRNCVWLRSGPSSPASSPDPHGYAKWTKPRGSSMNSATWSASSMSTDCAAVISRGVFLGPHFEQPLPARMQPFDDLDRPGVLDRRVVAVKRRPEALQQHDQKLVRPFLRIKDLAGVAHLHRLPFVEDRRFHAHGTLEGLVFEHLRRGFLRLVELDAVSGVGLVPPRVLVAIDPREARCLGDAAAHGEGLQERALLNVGFGFRGYFTL